MNTVSSAVIVESRVSQAEFESRTRKQPLLKRGYK